MAEWSKATDLRPVIVRCVGSNPTLSIKIFFCFYIELKYNINYYFTPLLNFPLSFFYGFVFFGFFGGFH